MAAAKKASYLEQYHRQGGDIGWHFLVGEQDQIDELASAVGYRYAYDEQTDQYAHASGITVLTPDGVISSYYLGIEYLPKPLQFAIMDAAKGNIGPLVDQVLLLCFAYDPSRGAYGFYIMNAIRLGGALVVALLLGFWLLSYLHDKRATQRRERGEEAALETGLDGNQ
jgi:protein SCO1/2